MSTQKRIFSLLLSFVMIFSIITSAGITSFASGKPSFVIDVSDAYVGEEVEIKVSAVDMVGLTAADLIFEYDQEYFEYISIEKSADALHDNGFGWYAETGILCYSFFYIDRATEDSGICVVRLKVLKEGATSISLKVDYWGGTEIPDDAEFEVTNQAKDGSLPFTYEIVDGEVTITGCDTSISGELIIPETIEGYPVTTIGAGAFGSCASLESITIPERLKTIEHHSFYGCTALESIIIPDSVTIIDYYAFAYCSSLESITIPDSVITIGEYAFGGCSSLTSITIPESVTTIGNGVFPYCRKLTEILVDSKNNTYCSDDGVLFNKDKTEIIAYPCAKPENSYIIPESVTKIGNSAFCDFCVNLESITIPANITTIDRAVFGCLSLTNIIINNPDCEIYDSEYTIYSDATIYGYANSTAQAYAEKYDREFVVIENSEPENPILQYITYEIVDGEVTITGCDKSISGDVVIPETIEGYPVTVIGYSAFSNCGSLKSIIIPVGIKIIDNYVFNYCDELTSIKISDSVTSIGIWAFDACSLLTITVDENNENYSNDEHGVLFNKDKTQLIQYPQGKTNTNYVIPDSVTSIERGAFANCDSLTSITIPDSVSNIGISAFANCDSLTSITIPESVTSFGSEAFADCDSLTSFIIPVSVTSFGKKILCECKALSSVIIENGVTSISVEAFYGCDLLTSVTIPESVSSISGGAFSECNSLTSITIPDSVTSIGNWAFYDCDMLESVTILNPDCVIYDSTNTIYSGATIYGYLSSTAQAYAEKYGREFVSIGHEHSYTSKVTAPTCTAKGYTTYTCDCGDSYKSNYKNAKGHKYTNACDTSCNTCKATRKITHAYKDVITKATLTKSGKIVNKCSVCGTVKSTKTIAYAKTIKLSATSYIYNGSVKKPTVTVKDSAGKTLKSGTDYTVTYASGRKNVGQYKVTITFKGNYSGTKTLTFNILPSKTSKITVTPATTTLKATWSKVTGATGYKVELLNSSGKVVKSATTTKLTYTFSKLIAGTNYKVKVTAYKTISGKNQYSTVSTTLATATKVATPTLKVTSTKKGVANFTWTNVAGENGYEVYYSTSKSSGFKSAASYKTNVAKGSKSKLTSGKTYYFKVRAFKTVNGKKVYGDWSKVVSVKIK